MFVRPSTHLQHDGNEYSFPPQRIALFTRIFTSLYWTPFDRKFLRTAMLAVLKMWMLVALNRTMLMNVPIKTHMFADNINLRTVVSYLQNQIGTHENILAGSIYIMCTCCIQMNACWWGRNSLHIRPLVFCFSSVKPNLWNLHYNFRAPGSHSRRLWRVQSSVMWRRLH
jgi:hypothetical protein